MGRIIKVKADKSSSRALRSKVFVIASLAKQGVRHREPCEARRGDPEY
jgi:hypothetical protein